MFAIGVHVAPPFVDDSHRIIDPEFPLKTSVVLFVPAHTVVTAGDKVPPEETGSTVIVPLNDVFVQGPCVVTV